MTDQDLDLAYTAVCNALAAAGPQRSERLLAMLCLALLVRIDCAEDVLPLIESVRQRALEP
jgi:hypothetical protein